MYKVLITTIKVDAGVHTLVVEFNNRQTAIIAVQTIKETSCQNYIQTALLLNN